jgi:hypothetical protein
MVHVAWFWLLLVPAVLSSPVSMTVHDISTRDNENAKITTGEPPRDRTIYLVLSLLCLMGIAFLLGVHTRCYRLHTPPLLT